MLAQLLPDDYKLETSEQPMFISPDEEVRIQQGADVRLRVVGVRSEHNELVR